jgi:hypothetical protein
VSTKVPAHVPNPSFSPFKPCHRAEEVLREVGGGGQASGRGAMGRRRGEGAPSRLPCDIKAPSANVLILSLLPFDTSRIGSVLSLE